VKAGQTHSEGNISTFGKFHNVLTPKK
jgi:hypothetical protein